MITIQKTPNKVKVILEYLPKSSHFNQLSSEEIKDLIINIKLKNGGTIFHKEIDRIIWRLRCPEDDEQEREMKELGLIE